MNKISEQQLFTWRYWAKAAAKADNLSEANFNAQQVVNHIDNEIATRRDSLSESKGGSE